MQWKDVAPLVAGVAPTLGGILGGLIPIPFGSVIGEEAGKLIATALGVPPTPEAVNTAITSGTPDTVNAALTAAETEATAKWPALAEIAKADAEADEAQTKALSDTAQAELVNGTPFQRNWRPLNGYVCAYLVCLFGTEFAVAMAQAMFTGSTVIMSAVFAGITSIVFFLSVPASIVGATAIGRSFEKVKALAAIPIIGGPLSKVAAVIVSKVAKRK